MKTIEGYTYAVNEHIGKGYSSTVHRGTHDRSQQPVSIKVIEMAKLEDPINQMLLQLEVTALKALTQAPHVLTLLDVYATKNNTYLITELMEGDLSGLLKQRRTIPYFEAVEVMRQLIEGYSDIHRAGYLHRDIKPANIFHKNGTYKFGDFGFAIPVSDLPNHRHYNVGSPVYMPPEALKNNQYSVSCDVWALGIIFYQMLKGLVPWRALSEKVLHEKILTEPLDKLTVGMPEPAKRFLA
jgi:serine/threonine protein kinase